MVLQFTNWQSLESSHGFVNLCKFDGPGTASNFATPEYQTLVSKKLTTWARAFKGKSYQAPCSETLSLAVYVRVHGCGICVVHVRTSRILLHAQSQGLSADLRPSTLSFWAVACCIKQWSPKGNDHVGQ